MKQSIPEPDDFKKWLTHNAASELIAVRGDLAATKTAFISYFRQGLEAGLRLPELMNSLPSIISRVEYSREQGGNVIEMLKALTPRELGISDPSDPRL
jgi:hypothetical protein